MAMKLRQALCPVLAIIFGGCSPAAQESQARPTTAPAALAPPLVIIRGAKPAFGFGGDSNNPAVWIGNTLHVFRSDGEGPSQISAGALNELVGKNFVKTKADRRNILKTDAAGLWFESVIADSTGKLYACYHAEYGNGSGKNHPRIGMQVSADGGDTWRDLGLILQTPENTDHPATPNKFFRGGNGDCSCILDARQEYLYFFFSQYSREQRDQGICTARMRWADRDAPAGRVNKWSNGKWQSPSLSGEATPFLANKGDIHGAVGQVDFWWRPSIHWNSHIQRHVILLNRATDKDWANTQGQWSWYTVAPDLANPTSWGTPQPLPFAAGDGGGWYPQVIGSDASMRETDKLAGRSARLFVGGNSKWEILFLNTGEKP